jgi:hypothetical protein
VRHIVYTTLCLWLCTLRNHKVTQNNSLLIYRKVFFYQHWVFKKTFIELRSGVDYLKLADSYAVENIATYTIRSASNYPTAVTSSIEFRGNVGRTRKYEF